MAKRPWVSLKYIKGDLLILTRGVHIYRKGVYMYELSRSFLFVSDT